MNEESFKTYTSQFPTSNDNDDSLELESDGAGRGTKSIYLRKAPETGSAQLPHKSGTIISMVDLKTPSLSKDFGEQTISSMSPVGHTLPFIQYKTKELVAKLTKEFTNWEKFGTEDALIYISNIKTILEKYARYLDYSQESRLLVGTLQLIFVDDQWEKMTQNQVNSIISEIGRFKDGVIEKNNFSTFSKQLIRIGINPLI